MADDMEYSNELTTTGEADTLWSKQQIVPGNWTAPMLRILLDYIEEEKGPDSIFLHRPC